GFSASASRGALGFGVTFGEPLDGTPKDQLWVLDVAAGTAAKLADASDSFTFGTVLIDPVRQRAFLTDANAAMPRIQVYEYANPAAPTRETSINASPSGLPTREISWF
ncbi:MAG: hypothetical protein H7138_25555, partial [Myxococcales bacterium]|nr:hypothetical protein [Myxococcales bacterium]